MFPKVFNLSLVTLTPTLYLPHGLKYILDGMTAAVVTLEISQVRPVAKGEITHARVLAPS
jgi:hypothetical protein